MNVLRKLRTRLVIQFTLLTGKQLRIVVGAGGLTQRAWIATEMTTLDLTKQEDFSHLLGGFGRIDAILAEHVWEHLDEHDGRKGLENCFRYLKQGAYLRLAVPDGFHPDPAYIACVRPGGNGPGADDHKVLYTVETLTAAVSECGFECFPLEYWDSSGRFHAEYWSPEEGFVHRSERFDERNADGELKYTSLIIDAVKPRSC